MDITRFDSTAFVSRTEFERYQADMDLQVVKLAHQMAAMGRSLCEMLEASDALKESSAKSIALLEQALALADSTNTAALRLVGHSH